METYYNIHNIVKIKVEDPKEYDYYLRYFKVDKLENVDIEILKGNNSLKIENGKITAFVRDNELCLNALIEYILLQKGYTFIHAAGVSYKDKGFVFPAGPGVGKTLLISRLRERTKFFADDYLILGEDGTMFSYPMDFSIYDYHFDFFEELKQTDNVRKIKKAKYEKPIVSVIRYLPMKRWIKRLAKFLRYDYLQGGKYLKVPAKELIKNFGGKVKTNYGFFLVKGNNFKIERIERTDSIDKEIVEILQSEWKKTLPYIPLDFNKAREIIKKGLNNAILYRVNLSRNNINKLEEFLWNL